MRNCGNHNNDFTNYNSNLKTATAIGKWNSKSFIILKTKTTFSKFGWTGKTCENIIYIIRFTAIQCGKLDTKAKSAICYCSTSESLSLSLEEQYLIITGSILLSTIWSTISVKFSYCKLRELNLTLSMVYWYRWLVAGNVVLSGSKPFL